MEIKELEFIRKAVIMACHSGCESYEEALRSELGVGFKVIDILHQFFGKNDPQEMIMAEPFYQENYDCDPDYKYSFTHYRGNPFVKDTIDNIFNKERFTVIGLPITLAKILLTFQKKWEGYTDIIVINQKGDIYEASRFEDDEDFDQTEADLHKLATWDFAKDLDGQPSKTILAIAKLLGYND